MSGLILGRQAAPPRSLGFVARERPADASLITYAGDGHLITFAPTGTGKTSGPVICNSLIHPGQLVVIDIKGEVHAATAQARRAMGQEVHVLDLHDDGIPGSLNPLDLIVRSGTEPASIARSFAAQIIERGTMTSLSPLLPAESPSCWPIVHRETVISALYSTCLLTRIQSFELQHCLTKKR